MAKTMENAIAKARAKGRWTARFNNALETCLDRAMDKYASLAYVDKDSRVKDIKEAVDVLNRNGMFRYIVTITPRTVKVTCVGDEGKYLFTKIAYCVARKRGTWTFYYNNGHVYHFSMK